MSPNLNSIFQPTAGSSEKKTAHRRSIGFLIASLFMVATASAITPGCDGNEGLPDPDPNPTITGTPSTSFHFQLSGFDPAREVLVTVLGEKTGRVLFERTALAGSFASTTEVNIGEDSTVELSVGVPGLNSGNIQAPSALITFSDLSPFSEQSPFKVKAPQFVQPERRGLEASFTVHNRALPRPITPSSTDFLLVRLIGSAGVNGEAFLNFDPMTETHSGTITFDDSAVIDNEVAFRLVISSGGEIVSEVASVIGRFQSGTGSLQFNFQNQGDLSWENVNVLRQKNIALHYPSSPTPNAQNVSFSAIFGERRSSEPVATKANGSGVLPGRSLLTKTVALASLGGLQRNGFLFSSEIYYPTGNGLTHGERISVLGNNDLTWNPDDSQVKPATAVSARPSAGSTEEFLVNWTLDDTTPLNGSSNITALFFVNETAPIPQGIQYIYFDPRSSKNTQSSGSGSKSRTFRLTEAQRNILPPVQGGSVTAAGFFTIRAAQTNGQLYDHNSYLLQVGDQLLLGGDVSDGFPFGTACTLAALNISN